MSITRDDYLRTLHIVGPAADELTAALRTDARGRRGLSPRVWLVGLCLSIATKRSGSVKSILTTLTVDLPLELQWDLGVRSGPGPKPKVVSETQLYAITKRVSRKLDYTVARQPLLSDSEREQRFTALQGITQALLKQTLIPRPAGSCDYAVDGTGLDAPERSPRKPDDLPDADGHEEDLDTPTVEQATSPVSAGRGSKGASDAKWGWRSCNEKREMFYGYDVEAMIRVPPVGQRGNGRLEPALLAALVVIPASSDVVDPVLGMLDCLLGDGTKIGELLGDRHYSHKEYTRWHLELQRRGISPVADLRSDDQGFGDWNGLKMVAGHPHCPFTPDRLADIPKPAQNADAETRAKFAKNIKDRHDYSLQFVNRATYDNQRVKVRCPARNGSVGCPRVEGSVAVAVEAEMTQVEVEEGNCPDACKQDTVTLRIETPAHRKFMKHMQPHYWGTPSWEACYSRRTHIEGFFGCLQNSQIGGIDRKTHEYRGIALVTLVYAVAAAITNAHILRKWHTDTGRGDPNHPLLQPDAVFHGFKEMTAEEAERLDVEQSTAIYDAA
jgi:hypothetical protein